MNVKPNEVLDRLAVAAAQKIKEKEYWLNRLTGRLEKTVFPIDHNKTGNMAGPRNVAPEHVKFQFTGEPFQRLMALSGGSDNRLFMILVGTLVTLLLKYTRNNDVIVGTTVIKQKQVIDETKLINTVLPLRIQTDDSMTFKDLLLEVKQIVTGANKNRNYPYDILLKDLHLKDHEDESPLFDIGILVKNTQDKRYFRDVRPNMIVSFLRTETHGEGELEYNTLLYETPTVKRLLTHFTTLLEGAIFNIDSKLSELNILTSEEKKRILHEFNNTKKDIRRDKRYHQLFEEQVEKTPDKIAVIGPSGTSIQNTVVQLTYRELNEKSNRLAGYLIRELSMRPDMLVGILMERSEKMVECILAVWKSGGAYIPLDTTYPLERIDSILQDSGAAAVITENTGLAENIRQFLKHDVTVLCLEELTAALMDEKPENPQITIGERNLVYVIYTSGSTGKPKGVMVEHVGMMNHIYAKIGGVNLDAGSVIAQNASHCFDISVWQFFSALVVGGRTVIYDRDLVLDIEEFIRRIDNDCLTILVLVPSYLSVFLSTLDAENKYPPGIFRCLQYLVSTGEAAKPTLVNRWFERFPNINVVNGYGPTEASDNITHYFMSGPQKTRSISLGTPLPNLNIYIVDKALNLCPVGVKGEILVSGLGVGRGYLNDANKTRDSFMNDPFREEDGIRLYKTGDIGRYLEDGRIEFFGRKDYQLKIRGFRIELGEIESRLIEYPGINEVVVIAKENGDKYLCAYFVSHREIQQPLLIEHMLKYLPGYMIPSYFIGLDKIPLTPNGKIDRKALPDPKMQAGDDYVAPRNKLEERLAELWAEGLNLEKRVIGIDSNFFKLGGHSLKATILITKIHKEFHVKFPLPEVFKKPNIRGMAEYIGGAVKEEIVSLEALEKKEYYPVSSQQKRLFILQQAHLDSTVYNRPNSYISEVEFDKERLEVTFRKVILRHESLRTSFEMIDGEPVQRIHSDVPFAIESHIDDLIREPMENFVRPFDLSRAPMLRVKITKTGDGQNSLMMDIHHIVSDGVSDFLLVNDFMELYQGNRLPALTFQYKDYSHWQTGLLETGAMKQQESYWLETFTGEIPTLAIPRDYDNSSGQRFQGSGISLELDRKETERLSELATREGATLFMLLLAGYNVLLGKLGGQEDIVVGTGVAGRRRMEFEKIIGMFVNTLPLRNFPAEEKTFKEYLREVKERTVLAFENQDYLYEDLVEKVVTQRVPGRNPLFDTSFLMQNMENGTGETADTGDVEQPESILTQQGIDKKMSIFDIAVFCGVRGGKLGISVTYSTGVFKKETIETYFEYFKDILSFIVENKELSFKLKDIRLASGLKTIQSTLIKKETGDFGF